MFTRALLRSGQAVILLVAGIFIGAALSSFAGGSIGVGACRHSGLQEGVWAQDQFDGFKGNLSSACTEAQWDFGGRSGLSVGLAHLGYLHGSNVATVNDTTAALKAYTGGACETSGKNCLARYNIDASEYGLTLGAFTTVGPFTLEGGVFVYRSEFEVIVQKIHEVAGFSDSERYRITATHKTPFVGVVLKAKEFYARLRVYQLINQDGNEYPNKGLTSGPTVALMAGVRF
jgi:hypothetical protein